MMILSRFFNGIASKLEFGFHNRYDRKVSIENFIFAYTHITMPPNIFIRVYQMVVRSNLTTHLLFYQPISYNFDHDNITGTTLLMFDVNPNNVWVLPFSLLRVFITNFLNQFRQQFIVGQRTLPYIFHSTCLR